MVDRASDASPASARAAARERGARGATSCDRSWHFKLARAFGHATRASVEELDTLTRTLMRLVDAAAPNPFRSAAASRRDRKTRAALLEKLGARVMSHSQARFSTLENDPVFWALLRRIHALRPPLPISSRSQPPRRTTVTVISVRQPDAADVSPAGPASAPSDPTGPTGPTEPTEAEQ